MGDASTQAAERFVSRIAGVRKARGLSQQALADAVGIDRAVLANIESGRRQEVRLAEALRLCHALRVDFAAMLGVEPVAVHPEPTYV